MRIIKTAEIFAGTASFSNAIKTRQNKIWTVDVNKRFKCSLTKNVLDLEREDFPYIPDILWFSPLCTWWSRASAWKYWTKDMQPKDFYSYRAIEQIERVLEIISWFPDAYIIIENPVGMLNKSGLLDHLHLRMIQYCQYGELREKPTHIWTNFEWDPRPLCNGGRPCKVHELRTDDLNKTEAGKVPAELCFEIYKILENKILRDLPK